MCDDPWWNAESHTDRRPFLLARGKVKSALRNWFEVEGFLEVECSALQVSPGNETHLQAFKTAYEPEHGTDPKTLFLHTSPEFSCKKLLAAGEEKIVDFARVYRNGEMGPLHSPEFTMVEWYRKGAGLMTMMGDCAELCRTALDSLGRTSLIWREHQCNADLDVEQLTCAEAFDRFAGINLEAVLEDRDAFAAAATGAGVSFSKGSSWSDIFSAVLVAKVERELGKERLTVLHDYPICEAALARPRPDDSRFAERFELYACGVELANGFGELTDAAVQRARFEADMALKQDIYGVRYPMDEDFLAALEHMPDASGVALGFERLVMLSAGARTIEDVIWTPFQA